MKRTAVAAFVLVFTTAAFAGDTQRYLVATKRPFAAGALVAVKAAVDNEVTLRDVAGFQSFDGFGADLTAAEVARLRRTSEVRWVEPVVERHALEVRNPAGQTIPYGITAIGARIASYGRRSGVVNVVVADTGIDYNHPELAGVWLGGWNVFTNNDQALDDQGHGTHVAGTIAAADNTAGVVGVAPHVRLWSVKVLDHSGSGTSEGLIKAMDWIAQQKMDLGGNWVVNLSLGSNEQSEAERDTFKRVAAQGILVVAAAGNESTAAVPAPVVFPAAYPDVLAVAATDSANQLATFSGQGPEVDLAAPGVGVLSTVRLGSNVASYVRDGANIWISSPITGSKTGSVTGEYVYCGVGRQEDFTSAVAGKIALIKRGAEITFADKTRRAKEAGAIAVAIFNHEPETSLVWTLIPPGAVEEYDWPVTARLPLEAGESLVQKGSGVITVSVRSDDYGEKSGTSMATPHVAGAAAQLWMLAPAATPAQIVNALITSARDLGVPGADPQFGAGLINVNAAARILAPQAFGGITTGRPVGKRR